ncbi:alpha/beta-type small acid-soluble spore protein [Thermosipho sp. (in: thermotogales)]|jgi:hypothetical protein|uniref:alpha/beta-type small acid-soluble spore protein n=1 Tax=Thermosipho sp. (in: thermotogales) TaxID=1968895 RepID=UPI00257EE4FB|nr:alpha/beta-type small acid-soluble spore protein [Thermosipho sp. (in: thermotogales)]MBZ4649245.1 small, acid-soluble spore protein beta [Thermosipho sp. (in: thermotogales)]
MANRNKLNIPEARRMLDKLKIETASELGITNYDQIDKGQLSSRDNGRVGGNMVRKMIEAYEQRYKNQ